MRKSILAFLLATLGTLITMNLALADYIGPHTPLP
jgi:hypothetical protein